MRKIAVVACAILSTLGVGSVAANENFSAYVDSNGGIRLPADFRLSMVHLGSWFVPTETRPMGGMVYQLLSLGAALYLLSGRAQQA